MADELDIEVVRREFEAWYLADDGLRSVERIGVSYAEVQAQLSWDAWLAAKIDSWLATPSPVGGDGLPPLPEPFDRVDMADESIAVVYSAEQVRQAQREAYEAGRRAAGSTTKENG